RAPRGVRPVPLRQPSGLPLHDLAAVHGRRATTHRQCTDLRGTTLADPPRPATMYADFHGLRELPFNVTPDPRFLYLNNCYQEALAALGYGIDARKGFISLVGEAGTGKTTLLRRLLDTVGPNTRTVLLLNPTVDFEDILEHILVELGVPPEGGRKLVLFQRLNEF